MNTPSRRLFLGLAANAVAVAAIGTAGARLISVAGAMPVDPDPRRLDRASDRLTQAQWGQPQRPGWGPGPGPGWGPGWGPAPAPPPPRRRRRRWVCWWHRGRRHCGWRWR